MTSANTARNPDLLDLMTSARRGNMSRAVGEFIPARSGELLPKR